MELYKIYVVLTAVGAGAGGFIWYLLRSWVQNILQQIKSLITKVEDHKQTLAEHTTAIAVLNSDKIGREELRESINELRQSMKADMAELKLTVKEDNNEIKTNLRELNETLISFMRDQNNRR